MLLPVDGETSIGLVFERKSPFLAREILEMRTLFPLIEGLHCAHQRVSRGSPVTYPPVKLTPRERDIVRLILAGFPSAKIAERLGVSVNTIKNHKKRMYRKLDITTERELILIFANILFHGA